MANIGGSQIIDATPGTTVTITIDARVPRTVARWTAGQNTTINISGTPIDGQMLHILVTNDGVLGRTLTLGTGLLGNGLALGIISKKSMMTFIADGGTFIETSRTIGI